MVCPITQGDHKKNKPQHENIYGLPITQGDHNQDKISQACVGRAQISRVKMSVPLGAKWRSKRGYVLHLLEEETTTGNNKRIG